ncbi:tol-pal system YbgF family protein [Aquimarina sp. AU58]|uniref:tetratricopeptide repeat protein n=1 Tax=Aquimarina sp. AU58 TaxID=1874112 RepID=UPI000D64666D|nr:hypothetical protein [Aquimarina sp. AU58]
MKEIQDKDIVLITRYFDLELSEKEMESFDQRLQDDPIFATKAKKYQHSINLIDKNYPNANQKQRTKKWKELIAEGQASNKKISWKRIAGIAAIFLLLISSWYFMLPIQESNLNELAKNAWNKNVGFSDYQVRNTKEFNQKKVVIDAFKLYKKKDYLSAIETLEKYDPSSLYYEDALLIRALSIHKTGMSKEAIQLLDSLTNHPTGRLLNEALWYKGLIYLDLNDLESARKYLKIPNNFTSEIRLKQ